MTTKFKILSSIAFIALAIVLTFVGVWALTDLDFTVGGNITYTAPKLPVYITMGTYEGEPVKWRLVGVDGEHFAGGNMPTSGTGTFILETLIDYNALSKTFDADSNDYATSDIRTYLTNESEGGYIYDILGIKAPATDAIYSAIAPRSITDLHKDIGWATGNIGGTQSFAPPAGTTQYATYDTTPSNATGEDKLWLMSVKEVYTLLGGGTIGTDKVISNTWSQDVKDGCNWDAENDSDYYWLRSPSPGYGLSAFYVNDSGGWGGSSVFLNIAVRPAFNIDLSKL